MALFSKKSIEIITFNSSDNRRTAVEDQSLQINLNIA